MLNFIIGHCVCSSRRCTETGGLRRWRKKGMTNGKTDFKCKFPKYKGISRVLLQRTPWVTWLPWAPPAQLGSRDMRFAGHFSWASSRWPVNKPTPICSSGPTTLLKKWLIKVESKGLSQKENKWMANGARRTKASLGQLAIQSPQMKVEQDGIQTLAESYPFFWRENCGQCPQHVQSRYAPRNSLYLGTEYLGGWSKWKLLVSILPLMG